jgi:hypothetical protein
MIVAVHDLGGDADDVTKVMPPGAPFDYGDAHRR